MVQKEKSQVRILIVKMSRQKSRLGSDFLGLGKSPIENREIQNQWITGTRVLVSPHRDERPRLSAEAEDGYVRAALRLHRHFRAAFSGVRTFAKFKMKLLSDSR